MLLSTDIPIENLVSRTLLTCAPDAPVCEVARIMAARPCSAAVVCSETGEVAGIWTEADALAIDLCRQESIFQPISAVMSNPVLTLPGGISMGEAAHRFKEHGVRHFLVLNGEGQPIGLLSQTDIVLNQGSEFFLRLRKVDSLLREQPTRLQASLPLSDAIRAMQQSRRDAVMVNYSDGSLGILTQRDVVRLIAEQASDGCLGDHASYPLRCVPADQSLYTVRDILVRERIRHIGVIDTNTGEVGLVSFSDILSSIEFEYVQQLQAALKERDDALWSSRYHLRLADRVLESTLEGVMITNAQGVIERVNPAFERLTGFNAADAIGQRPSILKSGRQDVSFYQSMWTQLTERGHWEGEIWNRRASGELYLQSLNITGIRNDAGEFAHYAAVFSDVTKRREAEERLSYLANHDALTDLPNRHLLNNKLVSALLRTQRHGQRLAVLFVDLDRFKLVNDTMGHAVGDKLLVQVAMRLRQAVRRTDTVARLGGDEFTVLLEDVGDLHEISQVAQKIVEQLGVPYDIGGQVVYVTTSIGISVAPEDGVDAKALLTQADRAMYEAKAAGKNGFHFYTPDMNLVAKERLQLEADLHYAIDNEELRLYYQPKVELATGRIVGMEALVRWAHPEHGLLGPDHFVPLAEESALIVSMGAWVLAEACRQGQDWLLQGLDFDHMAVNVSLRQLRHHGFVATLAEVLAESGFPPAKLQLELTESLAMGQADEVEEVLGEVAAMGVGLAIDDFGVGYASFANLKRLPFDTLKIDRSLLHDMGDKSRAVLRAIVAMAHALDMTVIVEGVETTEQAGLMVDIGCNQAQGWLFGRAVPAPALAPLLDIPAPVRLEAYNRIAWAARMA
ncbi:MAG: EAL domain-containing protein [Burkholderiales bacterium]|nr:EAL domain-containing protein [Burkholderiales bacterium]